MSPAGDIFDRKAKSVTPSPQVRAAVGIPDDAPQDMTPNELIKAILKAPVDLLWNGGIGTYVKSSKESNSDVGRPRERLGADQRQRHPRPGRRRGRQPGMHAARQDRVRARRRTDQHRLHRQLRRRRHVRPRGQLEDPAGARHGAERAHARRSATSCSNRARPTSSSTSCTTTTCRRRSSRRSSTSPWSASTRTRI